MSHTMYLPDAQELIGDSFVLKRLSTVPQYQKEFVAAVLSSIEKDYDEITPAFAQNLIAIDKKGYDSYGYFTLGKEVWLAFDSNNAFIGFEVVTRKRGGSIKIGPTYIEPSKRGHHYAQRVINLLLEAYTQSGVRKVYATAPFSNLAIAVLDFDHLCMQLEAVLQDHYKQGSAERISGRFLTTPNYRSVKPSIKLYEHGSIASVRGLDDITREKLTDFVLVQMSDNYDDIDGDFVQAIISGGERIKELYEQKPKSVFTLRCDDELVGIAVAAPKRGGAYKISPLLIKPEYRSSDSIDLITDAVVAEAQFMKRRKVSFIIPASDYNIIARMNETGYRNEGILRSPYKPGRDMVVLSRKLA